MLDDAHGRELARYARRVIAEALGGPPAVRPMGDWCEIPAATFVTLRRGEQLHGCIGTLEPRRSLVRDVETNAVAAALHDPRAPFLDLEGLEGLTVEVTLLSPLHPIEHVESEAAAIAALRPNVDGVVLRWHGHQGTFLPQVWADLPDPAVFLAHLKRKAGLPRDFWAPDVVLHRYSHEKWIDPPAIGQSQVMPS